MTTAKTHLAPIRTASDYATAQERAAYLLLKSPRKGTPEYDELDVLGILIAAYDREHFPIGPADPLAAIALAMDQRGWQPKDLVPYLGTRSRVTEVLQGQRGLSLAQIARLHHGLGIPLACLVPGEAPAPRVPARRPRTPGRVAAARVRYRPQ